MFRIVFIACLMWTATTRAEPARVVSLNPCLDTILLGVAEPAHVLTPAVTARGITNMSAVAVAEAQDRAAERAEAP